MRLVDGPDLKALLAADGPFDPSRAVHVVSQLADALAAAHAKGLVHRDVKPRNVVVAATAAGEHAYLVDFGLAREPERDGSLTTEGRCVGTLDYMAPEVLRGRAADAAADIYSLGCLLYELLTSRVPFPGDNEAAKITAHLIRRPPSLTLRDPAASALDTVVQRAMAKSPRDRYSSAADLAHAARRALNKRPKQLAGRSVETRCRSHARWEPATPHAGCIDEDPFSELLRRDDVRLVTWTDSRGVAETRLAIESTCADSTPRALAPMPACATANPLSFGRVLLIVDNIDPLAAIQALATPTIMDSCCGTPGVEPGHHRPGCAAAHAGRRAGGGDW
jgi:serine/threonine protein kinase